MEEEIWKPVKGYEGLYSVSSYGNVRSEDRIVKSRGGFRNIKGVVLKKNKLEYCSTVGLSDNNVTTTFIVHGLVARAFIENKLNLPLVKHLDGDNHNDHYKNLSWCDYTFNGNRFIGKYVKIPKITYTKVAQSEDDEILDGIIKYVQAKCMVNVLGNSRQRNTVYARALYCKLAMEYSTANIVYIGKRINKHHATVLHCVNNVFDTAYRYDEVIKDAYIGFNVAHNVINSDYIMRLREKLEHAEDMILKVRGYYTKTAQEAS